MYFPRELCRLVIGTLALFVLTGGPLPGGSICHADDVAAISIEAFATAQQALTEGERREQNREWAQAIKLYEAALDRWENDPDLTYALRRTKVHYGIDRRYSDRSFSEQLIQMPQARALDLFEEVLSRVLYDYLEQLDATTFVAHGTESLYMALNNSRFIEENAPDADQRQMQIVRRSLIKDYWNKPVRDRNEARQVISQVCQLAKQEAGIPAGAIVMEYISGGCNALDDYSSFLTPDRYDDLFGSIQGQFVGIGIEIRAEPGEGIKVDNVLLGSPAEAGGLRPGDVIVGIEGNDVTAASVDEAALLLRGDKGSNVNLTYKSPSGKVNDGVFIRRPVTIYSVTVTRMIDTVNKIGYIRQEGFQNNTTEELESALRKLERQGMKALIWDLRGNPGGLLDTAAEVVDRFVAQGELVSIRGRSVSQNQVFRADSWNTRNYPLVLLVDGNSASASEIVAGAVRDHNRGTIVGRKTYGKWSVQTILHLPENTGLRLTTAKFYSPAGKNHAGKGVTPDISVAVGNEHQANFRRATGVDELIADPDVERGLEVLTQRLTSRP